MSSLLALLSQNSPNVQTRKGLIVTGLQNDFTSPHGKLPARNLDFVDRVAALVSRFREHGEIIWVRTEYESDRPVDGSTGDSVIAGADSGIETGIPAAADDVSTHASRDDHGPAKRCKVSPAEDSRALESPDDRDDEELFLTRTLTREPCCIKGSLGAEYDQRAEALQDTRDMHVVQSFYSAFGGTSLLSALRRRLITELFICGCMTNLSVYSTTMEAARYGIRVILVTDCLGYRRKDRHDTAIQQLCDIIEAETMTLDRVVKYLADPDAGYDSVGYESEEESEEDSTVEEQDPPSDDDGFLEVDDDESEEEMAPSVWRLSGMLGRRLNLLHDHQRSTTGSPPIPVALPLLNAASTRSNGPRPDISPPAGPRLGSCAADQSRDDEGQSSPRSDGMTDERLRDPAGPSRRRSPHGLSRYLDQHLDADVKKEAPRSSHPGLAALSSLAGLSQSTVSEYEERMREQQEAQRNLRSKPLFGEDKEKESSGSRILYDLLPGELAGTVFDELQSEIIWQTMHHQTGEVPRMVCCQGTVSDDGSFPVYRHPSDQTIPLLPWTSTVNEIRAAAEAVVGHCLNHALIQLYRSGRDYISEHSDKTLDIVPGSSIVNVSFGAQRTMRLRTKRAAGGGTPRAPTTARITHRVPLPNNSMLSMSPATNAEYLHGIPADKRPAVELVPAETAFGGQRISLTFRQIGTFLDRTSSTIWGQGAVGKTEAAARRVVNGDAAESERLVRAFGRENQAAEVAWDDIYGHGFDVLHLR